MSAPESRINKSKAARPAPLHMPAILTDANVLLRKAIQQLPPDVRSTMVLRCDELARLQISEEALQQAFTQLLQLIVEDRSDGRLFLHITCTKEKEQDKEQGQGRLSRFLIQFHTNLTPHTAWMKEAERRTSNIASLLRPFGGNLLVNQLKNSGCVFVITLPGK